jgi:hypothetical protein
MFILYVLVVALIVARVRGGKFTHLGLLHFRWSGLILLGFLIQLIIFQPFWQERGETRALTEIAYLASMSLLLLPLLANLRLPGLVLIAAGFGLNFLAIALNGGHMPAAAGAMAMAGLRPLDPGQVANNSVGVGPETLVPFLTDIFAVPRQIKFANVFSIGDVLIAAGAFYLIQKIMVQPPDRTMVP